MLSNYDIAPNKNGIQNRREMDFDTKCFLPNRDGASIGEKHAFVLILSKRNYLSR